MITNKRAMHTELEETTLKLTEKTLSEAENTRRAVLTAQDEINKVQIAQRDSYKQMNEVSLRMGSCTVRSIFRK